MQSLGPLHIDSNPNNRCRLSCHGNNCETRISEVRRPKIDSSCLHVELILTRFVLCLATGRPRYMTALRKGVVVFLNVDSVIALGVVVTNLYPTPQDRIRVLLATRESLCRSVNEHMGLAFNLIIKVAIWIHRAPSRLLWLSVTPVHRSPV